ncbi:unnamed protein product [Angiostrongylus costaricensis]|uniref:Uncharacterized protein n=1 Tax=Angiostrongylus costaricensis TaxID=334426 RepID=A0A3P7I0Z7_ANGCS|nr:unnamed protein product [Angiostrongylus costaricensis]
MQLYPCVVVLLYAVLHLILTGLSLYGFYSSRPAFVRPFLLDVALSFLFLLAFIFISAFLYWRLDMNASQEESDMKKECLRNVYIGAAFVFSYLLWLIVSIAAYKDTKKLYTEFTSWTAEYENSMRSKANKSNKSAKIDQTSIISTSSDLMLTKNSAVNLRLSVPL